MRFPTIKVRRYVIAATAAALLSYTVGLAGVNPAEAVTDSRCSDGALISHVPVPPDLTPDLPSVGQSESTNLSQASSFTRPIIVTGSNLIPNPGLENVSNNVPNGWTAVTNGSLADSFPLVIGDSSGHAARVNITSYHSGSAYWSPGYVSVIGGAYYQYSDDYRANVTTWAEAVFKYPSGLTQAVNLGSTPKSLTWSPYTARFYVPVGVTQVLVTHNLSRIGSLETDNYALAQAKAQAFSQGQVSIAFVGAVQSDYQAALPILQHYDMPATLYVDTGFLDQPGYLSQSQLYAFSESGDEIASHSSDQANIAALAASTQQVQLTQSKTGLAACYGPVYDFAAPYDSTGAKTTTAISRRYVSNLSYDPGFNSPDDLNAYALKVESVTTTTPSAQIASWIATAKTDHIWLILLYRGVDNTQNGLSRRPAEFESDIQLLYASGLSVRTIHAGLGWVQLPSNLVHS